MFLGNVDESALLKMNATPVVGHDCQYPTEINMKLFDRRFSLRRLNIFYIHLVYGIDVNEDPVFQWNRNSYIHLENPAKDVQNYIHSV